MHVVENKVMRSVYLDVSEDADLRQLAFTLNITKSDLIRSAIRSRLVQWRTMPAQEILAEVNGDPMSENDSRVGQAETKQMPSILNPPSSAPDITRKTQPKSRPHTGSDKAKAAQGQKKDSSSSGSKIAVGEGAHAIA
jgi:hypothetical protein